MARDPPLEVEAAWPEPNFVNPEFRGPGLFVLVCVVSIMCVLVVTLRIYTRVFFRRNFWIDDWLIIPAMLLYIGCAILAGLGNLRYGMGKHSWDVPQPIREKALLMSWISEMLFTLSIALTKFSLCFFYIRLLGSTCSTFLRRLIYCLMGVIFVWSVGFTFIIIFQCHPPQAVYLINYPYEHCLNQRAGIILHASIDILTDISVYVLPMPRMWSLLLPRKQKTLVMGLFTLGGLVCICGIIRLPATLTSMSTYDVTWHIWLSYIWTNLECGLAIIVASLPSLTPLIIHYVPGMSAVSFSAESITKNPKPRPLPNTYPLANISTTVSGTHGTGWWGTVGSRAGESEENIIAAQLGEEENKITKTTEIKQRVDDRSEV